MSDYESTQNKIKEIHALKKFRYVMDEKFCQGIRTLRKNQTEILDMKNSTCEMENAVESLSNRLREAEEWMSKLKDKCSSISLPK